MKPNLGHFFDIFVWVSFEHITAHSSGYVKFVTTKTSFNRQYMVYRGEPAMEHGQKWTFLILDGRFWEFFGKKNAHF